MIPNLYIELDIHPPYRIDFTDYLLKNEEYTSQETTQKVKSVGQTILECGAQFSVAFKSACYETFKYSWTSFKYIVLGYYGSLKDFHPPADIFLAVFKVVYWFVAVGFCLISTTYRLLKENNRSVINQLNYLQSYAGNEINISHIQTKQTHLDISLIPHTVQLSQLTVFFDQINFDDKDQPGYMAPLSRQEGNQNYSTNQLKEHLNKFIYNVNNRVAFLGTPPAYDTPRLMQFYQQIEDAVRLSIYKTSQALNNFIQLHGEDFSDYSEEQQNEYKNLLEDRARLVINLAIAGKHCGARYMGEAMEGYQSFYREDVQEDQTLKASIIELLAHERLQIAKQHIQTHLGTDTHHFNNYMSSLGKMLALPNTENIVEHLSSKLDSNKYLTLFFETYTVDYIITTIEQKLLSSQLFREKVTDWLKDQVKEWNSAFYQKQIDEKTHQIYQKLSELEHLKEPQTEAIQILLEMIEQTHLLRNINPLNEVENLKDLLDELFPLLSDWTKNDERWSSLKQLDKSRKINYIKSFFSDSNTTKNLFEKIKTYLIEQQPQQKKALFQACLELDKVEQVHQILRLDREIITRFFYNKTPVEEAVRSYFERQCSSNFIQKLNFIDIDKGTVSPEIMEWILVSQGILLPQTISN